MLAENGQMAVHLPLSHGRIGAFSTHTAHPDVLAKMEVFLNKALGTNLEIYNPYVAKTKAEVVNVVYKRLESAIPVANSCWKNAYLPEGKTHCGECVPCLVRRIALESYKPDPTAYARDLFSEDIAALSVGDEGRRNLVELCEFILQFETRQDLELMDLWPELYSSNIDAAATIDMYRRAAAESRSVLSKYSGLAGFLQ
jgi:hypothetical protein